jgi:threonine-phosphate decarboxylase
LSVIPGLKFYKPETSFILGRILNKKFSAAELKAVMLKKGILIRDCSNFENLDDSYFRLAVKDRTSNMAFLEIFLSTVKMLLEAGHD